MKFFRKAAVGFLIAFLIIGIVLFVDPKNFRMSIITILCYKLFSSPKFWSTVYLQFILSSILIGNFLCSNYCFKFYLITNVKKKIREK